MEASLFLDRAQRVRADVSTPAGGLLSRAYGTGLLLRARVLLAAAIMRALFGPQRLAEHAWRPQIVLLSSNC